MSLSHQEYANAIRFLSIDAIEKANSGHPGLPMGVADIATVLFKDFMRFDPKNPSWVNRDRFILSAGHGSMLLYSLLYLTGYEDFTLDELKNFRQYGSKTAGHPEYGHGAGIETTTGPLGQGLATAVGMALGEKMAKARFGPAVDHYTYVLASDGDLMEGVSHEAIGLAGSLKLNKLIVLFDDNHITIDGDTSSVFTGSHLNRFIAAGWDAVQVDGHNPTEIHKAISKAQKTDMPSLIACRTIIGKGAPNKQNTASAHGSPLGNDEIQKVREHFNWNYTGFEMPDKILLGWRAIGEESAEDHKRWEAEFSHERIKIEKFLKAEISQDLHEKIMMFTADIIDNKPTLATRVASQKALEIINPYFSNMIGGSADLTGSNNTLTKDMKPVHKDDYSGRYLHYGVREHGMAAAMNGLALWGGFVPYGGTFLVFSDYMRPAMRLSALMGVGSIYVLTHDSIGLGEDGPTHQPVEHLASLRAIPNMLVFRPADAVETMESWLIAIESRQIPSCLALTRQGLPTLRASNEENKTAKGAYILRQTDNDPDVTFFASGSEVSLIVEAAELLVEEDISVRVVSVPCMELFSQQSDEYKEEILKSPIRIACEAAIKQSWEGFISDDAAFVGMMGFGASAPYKHLYQKFSITREALIEKAKERLEVCG